jgi:hypothetical protein
MEQLCSVSALLLLGCLIALASVCTLLLWLSRLLHRSQQVTKVSEKEYETLMLRVPACDFPDIPDTYAVGPIELVVPKTVRKRSDLMTKFIGKGIDFRQAITRKYFIDEITGMGFYEFTQEM